MAIYAYSFVNKKRDLADILSTVVKDEPRFISNFKTVGNAAAQKHEWLEDQIVGRRKSGVLLTPQKDKCGYVHVRLVQDRRYVLYKVHQLVGLVFLGYDRKNKDNLVIDRLNRNKN